MGMHRPLDYLPLLHLGKAKIRKPGIIGRIVVTLKTIAASIFKREGEEH